MSETNLGKWDKWYSRLKPGEPSAFCYGDTETYALAASFLADCETVEDWGCGAGGFQRFRTEGLTGVDGSQTPYADKIADLRHYRSNVDGILIRHVLEHDPGWRDILANAMASFQKKMCLVLFTPFSEETRAIADNTRHGVAVPDISFCPKDVEEHFKGCTFTRESLATNTGYGVEHVYRVSRVHPVPGVLRG